MVNPAEDRGDYSPSEVPMTLVGAMTHLAPRGSLVTETEVASLQEAAQGCMANGAAKLVLDLAAVPVLNSLALGTLIGIQESLVRLGGWLKLAHPNAIVRDVLAITRMDEYMELVGDESNPNTTRQQAPKRLGDILVGKGLLTEEKLGEAIELQKRSSRRMGQIIVDKGWVKEADVLMALGVQLGVPFAKLRTGIFDPDVVDSLDKKVARRLRCLPLQSVRGTVSLATSDPQDMPAFQEIEKLLGQKVQPVLCAREEILNTINDAYSGNTDTIELLNDVDDDFALIENNLPDDYTAIDELAEGSPVVNLVNSLVQRAVRDGASDIHIEPSRTRARVRFRIDGVLYEVTALPGELFPAVISRLKVMANLDIAERRMPQDGRIQVHTQGRAVDLRFSSLPGLYGEKVVLRVLDKNQSLLDINKLGMSDGNLSLYKSLIDHSHGLVLVTGPTGSGKTTSLYAALNYLNSIEKNIVTIEDPVEYQMDIVNQNEVRENIGLSFARILKHTLRQDPDIIMVGEIRERETAEIAVQAALTGHLVLSTLHTNHATGAITRMIDMGVEPYLLSSALIGVVAQRLVRGICPACRTTFVAPPEIVEKYGWNVDSGQISLAKGRGCEECYDSGYKGRFGIHEVLNVDDDLQRVITGNPSRDQLNAYLESHEVKMLFDDGIAHAREGDTTIEEISRVVNA